MAINQSLSWSTSLNLKSIHLCNEQANAGQVQCRQTLTWMLFSNRCCIDRWETGEWSSCSATCGVGLMTRTVACTHRPSRDSNRTKVLRDEDCQNPKPSPVQACNRFDCPPMWDTSAWGQVKGSSPTQHVGLKHLELQCFLSPQCSQSCAGGVQRRQVLCKQRLADGSILELPDTFCPSKSPANHQPCVQRDCPAHWVTTDWSQVDSPQSTDFYSSKSWSCTILIHHSCVLNIIRPVFCDLWKWHSDSPGHLQETEGGWAILDLRPQELFPNRSAHQNPVVLTQALWE